jgi:hypothetical protein
MLTCFVCKQCTFCNVKHLFHHFKTAHWLIDQHAKYTCCEGKCSRIFNDKFRFGKHLMSFHSDCMSDSEPASNACLNLPSQSIAIPAELPDTRYDQCEQPAVKHRKLDIKSVAARYIAQCKRGTTTIQQANQVARYCNSLVEFIVSEVTEDVESLKNVCVTAEQQTAVHNLLDKLTAYSRPFEGIETEYSHRKYLEHSSYYVAPTMYYIHRTTSSSLQQETGYVTAKPTVSSGQFISIEAMIHALHSKTDLVSNVLSCSIMPGSGPELSTFCDGLLWKRHPLVNEKVIWIRLYGDDFEPGNPLGSRRTLYKVGTVYFQFENLPTFLNSKLENIFLTLCYHTDDVKLTSWYDVLKPLLHELQRLESVGMSLTFNDEVVTFKVIVSCVTGDNLFLNSIMGFTESFKANYPCRHCSLHRDLFQTAS